MKTKDRYLLLPAAMLALAAVLAPLALAAAPFSAPRTQAAPAPSSASAELAALDLMLFVHRADLISAARVASFPSHEVRK